MASTFAQGAFGVCFVSALCWLATWANGVPVKSYGETTECLIAKLGSNRFKEREAASRLLLAREEAIPALRAALHGKDMETTRRVAAILKDLEQRRTRRLLDTLDTLVRDGAFDQFAELLARWPKGFQEDACLGATRRLVRTLEAAHHKQGGQYIGLQVLEDEDLRPYVIVGRHIHDIVGDIPSYFLRGSEVRFQHSQQRSLITAAGPVNVHDVKFVAIFAGGSVELGYSARHSIIVSDGDVKLVFAQNSLIIARGKILCEAGAWSSRFVGGETVFLGKRLNNDFNTVEEN